MHSSLSFAGAETDTAKRLNQDFRFEEMLSLPKKICIFAIGNPNDLGKKDIVPAFYISFAPEKDIAQLLRSYSRQQLNVKRIYFGENAATLSIKKPAPLINTGKGGEIKIFSLGQFAQRKKTPIISSVNAESLKQLCAISCPNPSFKTIIYLPN